jgi:hypothetical protein
LVVCHEHISNLSSEPRVDSAAKNIVRQRDSLPPRSTCYRTPVLCHALGPGSPARQGAGHE